MNLLLSFVDFISQYWFVLVMIIIAAIVFVPSLLNAKKEKNRRDELLRNLDKGINVVTIFGVHGVVKKLIEKSDGFKYVIITTGDDKNTSTLTVRIDAIAYIDDGTPKVKTPKKQEETEEVVKEDKE